MEAFRVTFRPNALQGLKEITAYLYHEAGASIARKVDADIRAACAKLSTMPHRHTVYQKKGGVVYRSFQVKHVRVVYRVFSPQHVVVVIDILHARRNKRKY